jgi:hypothetical protein
MNRSITLPCKQVSRIEIITEPVSDEDFYGVGIRDGESLCLPDGSRPLNIKLMLGNGGSDKICICLNEKNVANGVLTVIY